MVGTIIGTRAARPTAWLAVSAIADAGSQQCCARRNICDTRGCSYKLVSQWQRFVTTCSCCDESSVISNMLRNVLKRALV